MPNLTSENTRVISALKTPEIILISDIHNRCSRFIVTYAEIMKTKIHLCIFPTKTNSVWQNLILISIFTSLRQSKDSWEIWMSSLRQCRRGCISVARHSLTHLNNTHALSARYACTLQQWLQILHQSGSERPKIGQIWDFFRSDFSIL